MPDLGADWSPDAWNDGRDTAPLTSRATTDVVFRRPEGPVTCGRFLADVAALAARLPERSHVLNLCEDRYNALLGFAAALSRGQVMLLSSDRSAHRCVELAAEYPGLCVLADPGDDRHPTALPVHPEARGDTGPNPEIPLGRIAVIGFTSGSTGRPTAHPKPWGALVACARAAGECFGLKDQEGSGPVTLIATVPPQHMYGFETTIMQPLHAASTSHAGPNFYPVEVAEALRQAPSRRILVTTPLQMRALVASGVSMPALEGVISATAPLATELAEAAERAWNTRVLEIYGATEVGSIASRRTLDGPEWRLYRGTRFRPAKDDGVEVLVPGMTAAVPLADAIEQDADGRFRLLGRRADMVKLGGKRTSLTALNHVLTTIEGVEDGVFVAPEDLDQNPRARLAVYAVAPDLEAGEILDALRERLDPVFLPRRVVMLPALPRNEFGKLSRQALERLGRENAALAPPGRHAAGQARDKADGGTAHFMVPASHPCLPGHFPGQPLVPGVVLLDGVLAAVRQAGHGGVRRVLRAKFMQPVFAEETVRITWRPVPGRVGRFTFECHRGDVLLLSGEIEQVGATAA